MAPPGYLDDLPRVGRRYLFYSLISALVGVGISYLMLLGEETGDRWRQLAGGAVIGVTINTVIFGLELTVVRLLDRYTRVPRFALRIPHYILGGMLGFLLGQRLSVLLFPSLELMPAGGSRCG